jgi:ABC-2 type transport system ATP-binding protein
MNPATDTSPALDIRNLRVDYGDFTAVHDLNLTLAHGEIFGLAGPNGAGKTSTIRVLATLLEPTYGDVMITGYDLFEEPEAVHAVLGYMPDLAPVIPDLKVWEFLDLYAASYGLGGEEKRSRVDECLDLVDMSDKRDLYGRALSRGMTQRVVLAKTLLHRPRLLLLDEPASGMDPIARRDLRLILQRLAAAGASVVVSSHILSELSDMCTSVGIMHLGRLLQSGPVEEIQSAIQAERVEIVLEVVGVSDTACELLGTRDDVDSVRVERQKILFGLTGDAERRAEVLRALVAAGIEVTAFTPGRSSIESLLVSLIEEKPE